MELNVKIHKRVATYIEGDELPICGNSGDTIKFSFDEEWDAHETKTARFLWGGKYYDVEFTGDTCEIPVVKNTQTLLVGVYAGEMPEDGFALSTTNASIRYGLSTRCGNKIANPDTGANYTNEAKGYAAEAKAAAEAAAKEAAEAAAEQAATEFSQKTETGEFVVKRAETADAAAVLENDGFQFGRKLIKKFSREEATLEKGVDFYKTDVLPTGSISKFFVFEFKKYINNGAVTQLAGMMRTPAVSHNAYYSGHAYSPFLEFEIMGAKIQINANSNQLTVKLTDFEPSKIAAVKSISYCLSAVYEEI